MKVNDGKTQLICVSSAATSVVDSFVEINGKVIPILDTIKILGFIIDKEGGMASHIKHITRKVYMRNLDDNSPEKADVADLDLTVAYSTILRPIIEYASQLYHSMLTSEQSQKIEGLQRRALRIITGPGTSFQAALEILGLGKLSERRIKLCQKFALKTENDPRYNH